MKPSKLVIPFLAVAAAAAVPGATGAWEGTRMPGYASVRAFASVPAGLLAGTDKGRVYLTENAGADWTQVWNASDPQAQAPIARRHGHGPSRKWNRPGGHYGSADRGNTFAYLAPYHPTAMAAQGGKLYAILPPYSGEKEMGLPSRKISAMAAEGDRLAVAADDGQVWLRALEPAPVAVLPGATARRLRPQTRYPIFRAGIGAWRRIDGRSLPEGRPSPPATRAW